MGSATYTTEEKLQKLMDKQDTLNTTKSESTAMVAWRKSWNNTHGSDCFLCGSPRYCMVDCKFLKQAKEFVDQLATKQRTKGRNKQYARRRRIQDMDTESGGDSSESSDTPSDSEEDDKKKKKQTRKPAKNSSKSKKKGRAHIAVDTSDDDGAALGAMVLGNNTERDFHDVAMAYNYEEISKKDLDIYMDGGPIPASIKALIAWKKHAKNTNVVKDTPLTLE